MVNSLLSKRTRIDLVGSSVHCLRDIAPSDSVADKQLGPLRSGIKLMILENLLGSSVHCHRDQVSSDSVVDR